MDDVQRKNREIYFRNLLRYGPEVYKDFVITDECRFASSPDGHERVWREAGQAALPKFSTPKEKFDGASVMFWGAIWVGGRSDLVQIKGNMNADLYIEMLETIKP